MAELNDPRTDEALLAAVRQGDAGALEALIERYRPRVYRFGVKMCRNVEDAGDVVQESLLAMARSVREFRGDASVSTWLYTIRPQLLYQETPPEQVRTGPGRIIGEPGPGSAWRPVGSRA